VDVVADVDVAEDVVVDVVVLNKIKNNEQI
jgi:hypothetical protein